MGGTNHIVGYFADIDPALSWQILSEESSSCLIDVRTSVEWAFVGIPDLSSLGKMLITVEWQQYPSMSINQTFADDIRNAVEKISGSPKTCKLMLLCRSGVRSAAAAELLTEAGFDFCYNVNDGFEGQLDKNRQRGNLNGWKASNLPWLQS